MAKNSKIYLWKIFFEKIILSLSEEDLALTQNQGEVERANSTLVRKLTQHLSNTPIKRWIDILDAISFKYNNTWHIAINTTAVYAFKQKFGFNSPLNSNTLD